MKMKKKNRSHRYDINRPKSIPGYKYSKYKTCFSIIMLIYVLSTPRHHLKLTQFMKKLSKTEAELKKSVAALGSVYGHNFTSVCFFCFKLYQMLVYINILHLMITRNTLINL